MKLDEIRDIQSYMNMYAVGKITLTELIHNLSCIGYDAAYVTESFYGEDRKNGILHLATLPAGLKAPVNVITINYKRG